MKKKIIKKYTLREEIKIILTIVIGAILFALFLNSYSDRIEKLNEKESFKRKVTINELIDLFKKGE